MRIIFSMTTTINLLDSIRCNWIYPLRTNIWAKVFLLHSPWDIEFSIFHPDWVWDLWHFSEDSFSIKALANTDITHKAKEGLFFVCTTSVQKTKRVKVEQPAEVLCFTFQTFFSWRIDFNIIRFLNKASKASSLFRNEIDLVIFREKTFFDNLVFEEQDVISACLPSNLPFDDFFEAVPRPAVFHKKLPSCEN